MSATVSCPDGAVLSLFALGQMPEAEIESLGDHIAQCQQCVRTLESLQQRDTLLEALAADPNASPGDPTESVRVVIERLKIAAKSKQALAATTTGDAATDAREKQPSLEFLAAPEQPDEIGRLGAYRVLKLLGQGGMGLVFQAEDMYLKRRVALKVMRPRLAQKPESRERFLREARAAAAIEHDHIVTIHQVGEANGVPFLAMPCLKGMSLEERLQQTPTLPSAEIARLGRQIASGLAAAHACGLIHRDIKPGNIWLEAQPDDTGTPAAGGRVKILDFGLAKPLEEAGDLSEAVGHITQSGAILGTPLYMAPEQARGEPVDARSDLFSLGVVLYRMCTGQLPFQGATTGAVLMALASVQPEAPRKLNPEVPAGLSDLIQQLLAKDQTKRPASAREVGQRLQLLEGEAKAAASNTASVPTSSGSVRAAPAGAATLDAYPAAAASRAKSKRRLLIAAALLLLIGGGALALYQLQFATPQGTLLVETDDPAIEARFKSGVLKLYGPDDKLLYTIQPSERNKMLPAGKYKIEVAGADGLTLDTDAFTLKKDGKETVRVLLKPVAVAQKTPEDAWLKEVAALPPAKQVEAVTAKLKERNPDWKGQVKLDRIEGGVVTGLTILGTAPFAEMDRTLTDVSPVRALVELKRLTCTYAAVSTLSPLKGMQLTWLECPHTLVDDLTPLKNMPLTRLNCSGTKVSDLSPLKGMQLTWLECAMTPVTDLSPLKDMPLKKLHCAHTSVSDLLALKGMQLTWLECYRTKVSDLSTLKGMPLTRLHCEETPVSDLTPLKGTPLAWLNCGLTQVTNLSPLKETPIKELLCDDEAERDIEVLRSLKSLQLINGTSVTQIQEELDLANGPLDEWLKKVATLPPQKQVRAVAGRLRLDNPARVELQKVEGGVVTAIKISGTKVSDLTPVVRALPGLKSLDCGSTAVSDRRQASFPFSDN